MRKPEHSLQSCRVHHRSMCMRVCALAVCLKCHFLLPLSPELCLILNLEFELVLFPIIYSEVFFSVSQAKRSFHVFYIKCCFFETSQKEKIPTSGIVPKLLLLSHPNTHTFSTSSCTCTIHPSSAKTNPIYFYIHIVHIFPH